MAIVHIVEARGAAVMWLRAHVHVVPLTMTQDATAPFGALLVNVVSAIFLALTAVESLLALTLSTIVCMLVVPFLGYASNGGIVDEGGTDSTTITPCRSSNVAIAGMVVVMSLVMSLNGVKVRQDLVLDVSKSGSIGATKQDLIKIKSRSSGELCSTSPY
jgi:hypothetical protein